jgi:TonB family protein
MVLAWVLSAAGEVARAQDTRADNSAATRPVLVPPRLLEAPSVELPEGAAPLPPDAAVDLTITIEPDGTVREAVIDAPLRPDVDGLVLEAARAMRFQPATRDGTPIPARIRFRYRIATAPPPAPGEDGVAPARDPDAEAPGEDGVAPARDPDAEAPGATFSARATAARPEPGAATRVTLTGAELSQVPGTFGDPLRVVAALPGVLRPPFGIGFFVVRGANFQDTVFMIDGFPVPLLYHLGFGPSVIPPRLVQRMHFYPGNYPVRWGRYSGALIGLDTGAPETSTPIAELQVDLLRASGLVVVPWDGGRGTLALGFRRSYYDLLLPLFVQGLSLQFTDYQMRAEYRWDRWSASIFLLGSDDSLDQSGAIGGAATSAGANTGLSINFQRVISRIVWRLGGASSLTLSGTVGRDSQTFGTQGVGEMRQRFGFETWNAGLRLDAAFGVVDELAVNAGIDLAGTVSRIDVTAPAPPGLGEYPRPIFDPQLVTLRSAAARGAPGSYAEAVLRFDPIEISIGARLDLYRYGTVTHVAADPRLVARWQVIPEWLLKGGTGLFTQPPIAIQTISTGGNPALGPQRAWQSSLGTELRLPFDLQIEVNGFYSHMFDLPRFSQRIVPGQDGQPRREFFRGDQEGRAYGIEVLVRRPVQDGFFAWISYTWSRSERRNPGGNWFLFGQDQEHVLNLVASYYIEGWRFGARFTLATGRPTPRIRGGVYDADANDYDPTVTGEIERLPVYHQLDLRIDRDWTIGPVRGTVYLDVLNVYYGQNAEGVIYQYDFARSVPLPGIPVLGTLGVQARIE